MASITVTDNFFSDFAEINLDSKPHYTYRKGSGEFKASAANNLDLFIDGSVASNLSGFQLLSLKGEATSIDNDELVLSIQRSVKDDGLHYWRVKSGNFVGNIQYQGHSIELTSRFSERFLQRMLAVANNVHLSDFVGKESSERNYAEFILYYLFVQKLEKAFLLGFPKTYQSKKYHKHTVKGKVDVSRLICKDIPFKGRVSSINRERAVDAAVLSVLNKVLRIVFKRAKLIGQNVRHVHNAILQLNPQRYGKETLKQAKASKSLDNPLFSPFREILGLAELIINRESLKSSKSSKDSSFGFLVNVAELFELYIKGLLQKNFPDWSIFTPQIQLYETGFYSRKIIPDIVIVKDDKVIVLDTKYKQMQFRGTAEQVWDLERSDFFQIHTYMSYFHTHHSYQLLGGGLIYPLSVPYDRAKTFSENVLGNNKAWFCVDGIEVLEKAIDVNVKEAEFIERVRALIEPI